MPTFISIPFRTTSYSILFPFIPILSQNHLECLFFWFDLLPRGCTMGLWRQLRLYTYFFCEAAQWTWSADKANETAALHRLVDFQHPRHFYARHLLKVKARVHDKESKDLKRLYRCDGRIQLIQINSSQSKCLRFCRKVTFFLNAKQGDEGSIRNMLWQAYLSKDLLESVRSAWIPVIEYIFC